MDKIYINKFKDTDSNDEYFIVTKKDCSGLLEAIESYYYDIESYESKEEFLNELISNEENADFINYISEKFDFDNFSADSIYEFTIEALESLDLLLPFELCEFTY